MTPKLKKILTFSLFAALLVAAPIGVGAQSPAPLPFSPFSILLADMSQVRAQFLPGPDGQAWMVYALPSQKIVLWRITPISTPLPPDPDPLPPDPLPPPVQPLRIAIVENPFTTTIEQRSIILDPSWRESLGDSHKLVGVIQSDIVDPDTDQPPEFLKPFLSAAQGRPYPQIVFLSESKQIIFVGPLPVSSAEIAALITKHGG